MAFVCDLAATLPLTPVAEAKNSSEIGSIAKDLRRKRAFVKEGASVADIRAAIDPEFIHHTEHYERMIDGGTHASGTQYPSAKGFKSVRLEAAEGVATVVIDGSREWQNRQHTWETRVRFNNYDLVRKQPGLTWTERARLLLRDNVSIHCSCPAYRWYHQIAATKAGFALIPESRLAHTNNPDERGGVCKHLDHTLRYLGGSYTTFASAMKKHFAVEESAMYPDDLTETKMYQSSGFEGDKPRTFTIHKHNDLTHMIASDDSGSAAPVAVFHRSEWSKVAAIGKRAAAGEHGFYDRVTDVQGNHHKVAAAPGKHAGHLHFSHRVNGKIRDFHIAPPTKLELNLPSKAKPKAEEGIAEALKTTPQSEAGHKEVRDKLELGGGTHFATGTGNFSHFEFTSKEMADDTHAKAKAAGYSSSVHTKDAVSPSGKKILSTTHLVQIQHPRVYESVNEAAGLAMIMEITKLKNTASQAGMSRTAQLLNVAITAAKLEGASMVAGRDFGASPDDRTKLPVQN